MRRFLIATLFLALAIPACARNHRHSTNISIGIGTDDWSEVNDCSDIRVTFDGRAAARAEENVAVGAVKTLRVEAGNRGGVYVVGNSPSGYDVRLCKAAALASDLANVHARVSGSTLTVVGDSDGDDDDDDRQALGFYLVRAPRGASLDLAAMNGSISVHGVEGTIRAVAENGPIAIKHSLGTVDARSTNGPIALAGGGGNVKLRATNGPVSVKLDGTEWKGGSLDAETQNGPVSLKLPRGYRSGVVIDTDGNSPVRCRAEGCTSTRASRYDDDDDRWPRRLELGSGARVVHLRTANGPVTVKERDGE